MVKIIARSHPNQRVQLGQSCDFEIAMDIQGVKARSFLRHQGIFYLKPLTDWSTDARINVFPEAPGKYVLSVEWQTPTGAKGWVEEQFEVTANLRVDHNPQQMVLTGQTRLWIPSNWEAQLLAGYEQATFEALSKVIQPEWVFYDIGANLGQYSIWFSHASGKGSHIYCFEANPLCIYFLRANLELNGIKNYDIFPSALSDSQHPANFSINYSNTGIGVTQQSVFYGSKVGHEIAVQGYALDYLIDTFGLKKPDLIKLDIEGAEASAIVGMHKTVSRYRPVILLEAHGKGPAEKTLRSIDPSGYHYEIPSFNKKYPDVEDLLAWFPEKVIQVICHPAP